MPWAVSQDGQRGIWLDDEIFFVVKRDGQEFISETTVSLGGIQSIPTVGDQRVVNIFIRDGKLVVEFDTDPAP